KGQGDGPSRYEDPDTGTVIEVQSIDDTAGTARLKVTRELTRVKGTLSGVAPFTTTLTAAGPPQATFTWDDGTTGTTSERTFANPGTYNVSVTSSNGGTSIKQVKVYAPATGNVALTAPQNLDTGATANVSATLAGQDLTIEAYRAGVKVANGTNTL